MGSRCRVRASRSVAIYGDVQIGADSSIWHNAVIRADLASVRIGKRTNIQDCVVVHTDKGHPVVIGSDVSVGHSAVIHGCTIRDRVIVGMGAIVMNDAVIEEDSIIGAGAIVTSGTVISGGSVVAGVPSRKIGNVNEGKKQEILHNAEEYIKLATQELPCLQSGRE